MSFPILNIPNFLLNTCAFLEASSITARSCSIFGKVMFEISFSLSVATLTTKTYAFFCLKADCDPEWSTELVPGPPNENWIDFKGNLLSRSRVFQLELLGAKAEFGVLKDTEHIAFAQIYLEMVDGKGAVTTATMRVGNDLEVATIHLEAKVSLFSYGLTLKNINPILDFPLCLQCRGKSVKFFYFGSIL